MSSFDRLARSESAPSAHEPNPPSDQPNSPERVPLRATVFEYLPKYGVQLRFTVLGPSPEQTTELTVRSLDRNGDERENGFHLLIPASLERSLSASALSQIAPENLMQFIFKKISAVSIFHFTDHGSTSISEIARIGVPTPVHHDDGRISSIQTCFQPPSLRYWTCGTDFVAHHIDQMTGNQRESLTVEVQSFANGSIARSLTFRTQHQQPTSEETPRAELTIRRSEKNLQHRDTFLRESYQFVEAFTAFGTASLLRKLAREAQSPDAQLEGSPSLSGPEKLALVLSRQNPSPDSSAHRSVDDSETPLRRQIAREDTTFSGGTFDVLKKVKLENGVCLSLQRNPAAPVALSLPSAPGVFHIEFRKLTRSISFSENSINSAFALLCSGDRGKQLQGISLLEYAGFSPVWADPSSSGLFFKTLRSNINSNGLSWSQGSSALTDKTFMVLEALAGRQCVRIQRSSSPLDELGILTLSLNQHAEGFITLQNKTGWHLRFERVKKAEEEYLNPSPYNELSLFTGLIRAFEIDSFTALHLLCLELNQIETSLPFEVNARKAQSLGSLFTLFSVDRNFHHGSLGLTFQALARQSHQDNNDSFAVLFHGSHGKSMTIEITETEVTRVLIQQRTGWWPWTGIQSFDFDLRSEQIHSIGNTLIGAFRKFQESPEPFQSSDLHRAIRFIRLRQ